MESPERPDPGHGADALGAGQAAMLLVSLLLLWLAIAKKFEPLLLLPIGFGGLLPIFRRPGWRSPPWRACWLTTTRRSWR
ncbi:sodium ion-translocating decarboxylase subunit beta [Klebsiella pneumoniae]|uniref:sodium ion-translocating decarboxylase subunit beta n=1 Tax=Klebsiella pneumoniae TaxID=573 RepID=UPI0019688107|nr:sodium ion-translocating decarboxylase subunit beta [Klebsiella pneumoniae]